MPKGKHWSYDGRTLRIFDVYSCREGDELFVGETAGCQTMAMAYERASQTLSSKIGYIENAGFKNEHQVLYIQINEYMAHLLFDEGFLSIAKLEAADEDDNCIFVPMVLKGVRRIFAIRNDIVQAALYFGPAGKPVMAY